MPSWTNCKMTVDVIVLVLLPTRKESSTEIGLSLPIVPVPNVSVQSPSLGDLIITTAPGITLLFIT